MFVNRLTGDVLPVPSEERRRSGESSEGTRTSEESFVNRLTGDVVRVPSDARRGSGDSSEGTRTSEDSFVNRLTGGIIRVSPKGVRRSAESSEESRRSEDSVGGRRISGFSMDERRFSGESMEGKRKLEGTGDPANLAMGSLTLQSSRQATNAPIGSPPSWQLEREPRAPRAAFKPKDFKIGKLLGLGSYSKVAQATLIATGQEYALKVMDKAHIIREKKILQTKRERNILDRLGHPGVVRLCFTFQDEHSLYMGLELCPGGELFDQIKRRGRLPLDTARFYAAEVVDCLEHIHTEGVVHRDLKPENLLFTSDGHLKLGDFGSAIFMDEGVYLTASADEPRKGSFVGTAEYVSPEMLNSKQVSASSDFWALGCLIYQMLVGLSPFKAASEYLCFQRILQRNIAWPSDLPPAARDVIDRLLDVNPETRLGSSAGSLAALKAHPFFAGIDWRNVRGQSAPPLLPAPAVDEDDEDGEERWEGYD